jgi:hypothetical protein
MGAKRQLGPTRALSSQKESLRNSLMMLPQPRSESQLFRTSIQRLANRYLEMDFVVIPDLFSSTLANIRINILSIATRWCLGIDSVGCSAFLEQSKHHRHRRE